MRPTLSVGLVLFTLFLCSISYGDSASVSAKRSVPSAVSVGVDTLPRMLVPASNRGGAFTALPDVNGDDTTDLLVGMPEAGPEAPLPVGRAVIYSGTDGQVIDSLGYPELDVPEHRFGLWGNRVGDLDGDGTDDLILNALNAPAYAFSGASLEPIRPLPIASQAATFAPTPDVTGDGVKEILAGMTRGIDSVYVIDGTTGTPVRGVAPTQSPSSTEFGEAVTSVGDLNGDGTSDLAVGAPADSPNQAPDGEGEDVGRVFLFSGRTGELLRTLSSPSPMPGGRFGSALAAPGDVDDDGTPDLAVGEPGRRVDETDDMGRAYVISGTSGDVLFILTPPPLEEPGHWSFGRSLTVVGDLNDDDTPDLFVGAPGRVRSSGLRGFLFDGSTGRPLPLREPNPPYGHPQDIASGGNLNGDGTVDLLFRDATSIWAVSGRRVRSWAWRRDERPAVVNRYPVKQDGTWGYIDATGDLAIPSRFENADPFSEGLATVTLNDQPAVIDSTGAVALRPDVSALRSFSGGLAAASPADTPLWGYIDTTGAYAIAPQFAEAYDFSNGRAAVKKTGAFGYVNRRGQMVIDPQFKGARRFGNGRAPVRPVDAHDKWGYIGRSGEIVIEPRYEEALPFSEGRAAVSTSDGFGDYGFINPAGDRVIDTSYEIARTFSNGLAPVQGGFDDKWGYVDRSGKLVIDLKYAFADPFHGPLGRVAKSVAPIKGMGIRPHGGPIEYIVNEPEWAFLNRAGEQMWP